MNRPWLFAMLIHMRIHIDRHSNSKLGTYKTTFIKCMNIVHRHRGWILWYCFCSQPLFPLQVPRAFLSTFSFRFQVIFTILGFPGNLTAFWATICPSDDEDSNNLENASMSSILILSTLPWVDGWSVQVHVRFLVFPILYVHLSVCLLLPR